MPLFLSVSRRLLLAVNVPYGAKLGADCSECERLCASLRSTIDNRAELLREGAECGEQPDLKNGATEATERTEKKTSFVFFVSTVFSVTPF
jgi:hypothetical protein